MCCCIQPLGVELYQNLNKFIGKAQRMPWKQIFVQPEVAHYYSDCPLTDMTVRQPLRFFTSIHADTFASFFTEKVAAIGKQFDQLSPPLRAQPSMAHHFLLSPLSARVRSPKS